MIEPLAESDALEQRLARAGAPRPPATRAMRSGISAFSIGAELRQQVVELKDEADVAVAERHQLGVARRAPTSTSPTRTSPDVGPIESAEHVQQRALPDAGRAHRSPPSRPSRPPDRDRAARAAGCRRTGYDLLRPRASTKGMRWTVDVTTHSAAPAPDRASPPGATDTASRKNRRPRAPTTTSDEIPGQHAERQIRDLIDVARNADHAVAIEQLGHADAEQRRRPRCR